VNKKSKCPWNKRENSTAMHTPFTTIIVDLSFALHARHYIICSPPAVSFSSFCIFIFRRSDCQKPIHVVHHYGPARTRLLADNTAPRQLRTRCKSAAVVWTLKVPCCYGKELGVGGRLLEY
jgi:hypothetical protein